LLENTSRENSKCVFNEKLEHVDDFSFREIFVEKTEWLFKTGLQKYYDTSYTRSGVNQMCILKNSKELLEYIQSRSLSSCNSIKTFDYSNLYTTIPHSKRMESSRVAVDPVLLLWLKVQRNITQTYYCPDLFFRKSRRGICRVATFIKQCVIYTQMRYLITSLVYTNSSYFKFLCIPLRMMPDNEQKEKWKPKILIPNGI
jgi:hypothetical protein